MPNRGLVLVTGSTGSGKSNTLAAMLNFRNENAAGHFLAIEDPIEFMHDYKRSVIDWPLVLSTLHTNSPPENIVACWIWDSILSAFPMH